MGKKIAPAEIGEKKYVFEFTRRSICKAEEAFGVSMMKMGDFSNYAQFNKFVNALLYGALVIHQPEIQATEEAMEDIHNALIEAGYDETNLVESLVELLTDAINPMTGDQKKTLLTVRK